MDIVTLGAALNGSKKYTDQVTQSLMGGVHYRGSVSYYDDLPANPAEGDSYTVKYAGSSGSVEDGTEYTWGYDTDTGDYAWISFSKDAYSKAETNVLLSGKQATLSQSQLNAVNSGIDSERVEQITTNKNNISLNTAEITGQQNATTDTVAGRGYAIINGQRLYMGAAQTPERTGDIWLDGATVRESEYLLSSNPICGISTYKDTLNLATGACTRYIYKLVFDGTESWQLYGTGTGRFFYTMLSIMGDANATYPICSHSTIVRIASNGQQIRIYDVDTWADATDFKNFLSQQYANGTPVTIWYVLLASNTETITVPTGNVGTVEGYLIQDGTPTPTDPIYPTANQVPVWG